MNTTITGTALDRANNTIIRYPRFKALHVMAQRCQEQSKIAGEPQCMSLEGRPGAGKSTLVREYAQLFARTETDHGTIIPVFYMETPSPISVKGMAESMLQQLGDPMSSRGTLWSMNARLIKFLVGCRVELVILDDFHHLIDTQTNRILQTVSEWLKFIIKEAGVPFLTVGIEGQVTQILRANQQLSRLFAVRENLHPFGWDANRPEIVQELHLFVGYAERGLGIPIDTGLGRLDFLYRIHWATDGVVANIMNLLRDAQWQAAYCGASSIGLSDLSNVFSNRIINEVSLRIDPFLDGSSPFVPPAPPVPMPTTTDDEAISTRSRARSRKRKASTGS